MCRFVFSGPTPRTPPGQPPLTLCKGPQGHRPRPCRWAWALSQGQALGRQHGHDLVGCWDEPPPPRQPITKASAHGRTPTATRAQPAAASHLLGIADPEGNGVEMDEAASQGLKGRGKQGSETTTQPFPQCYSFPEQGEASATTLQVYVPRLHPN